MADKLQEYKDRQKEWRDISITQLSTANNILLTLSSGLLVFCIDKKKVGRIYIDFSLPVNWQLATYWASVFLLGLSILFGIGVLLSRLYDFRISRHLALTRQRFTKETEGQELPYNDLGSFKRIDRVKALFAITFQTMPFINPDDIKKLLENNKLKNDFQYLRRTSDKLGSGTWRWTKIQIGLFLVSGVVYLIHQLTV